MSSWRIEVNEQDRSPTVIPSVDVVGAFVLGSTQKGTTKPVKINPNQEGRIINLVGYPSVSHPEVWEAIEYNKGAPIWLSAPYNSSDEHGYAIVGANGTEPSASGGLTDSEIESFTFASGDEYFLLTTKSPQTTDDIGVKVSKSIIREGEDNELDTFLIQIYKKIKKQWTFIEEHTVALDPDGEDGFGRNIYIENVLEDNDFIEVLVNDEVEYTNLSFVDDTSAQTLAGNSRSDASESELAEGWDYFKKPRNFKADIFMDTTKDPSIPTLFDTLRNNFQKYAFYVIPLPMGEDVSTAITTKEDFGVDNAGLAFYWNHGKVQNRYGTNFWTSLIGRVGQRLAAMADVYNAGAPQWRNEDGHGGQLGPGILDMEYDPSETELENMDEAGINAIVFDPSFGAIITSQRTGQSPSLLSDNSWIAHRRMFDSIISNIVNQVLTPQIGKLNDAAHRQTAESLSESIVAPVAASNYVAEWAVICNRQNNTDNMLAQRYFVLDVIIKVTPYSERLRLNFSNIDQNTTVQEFVG